jgi:hypothetical protein
MSAFKVLWVYQQVATGNGVRLEAGQKPSLCFKGRKHMYCVAAGYPVRVIKREVKDFDRLREVRKGANEYPVDAAIDQFRAIARRCGITKGAEAVLVRAENAALNTEEIEDSLTNEEDLTMMTENPAPVTGEATTTTTTTTKETKVTKPKATKKAAPKKSAPKKAAPKAAKAKGPTPFRVGTMKEKAFIEFKASKKAYDALAHGEKTEWCTKLAKKLGASVNTVKSWVGGQFTRELAK